MCIAIYHDQRCPLTESEFENSWRANPDGGGFVYFDENNELVIKKSMDKNEMKKKYYDAIEKYSETSPFAVHFRIATHGGVNIDNVHPFRANAHTVVMHNGIIPVLMDKGEKRSDTRVFVDEYMSRLPKGWLDDEYIVDMTEEFIGSSKLIIMTNDPRLRSYLYILNEKQGHWSESGTTWYSNKSYCTYKPQTTKYSLSSWDQMEIQDDTIKLAKCKVCGENAVFDDLCYNCDSCVHCNLEEDRCKCYSRIHEMTDSQYKDKESR